MRVELLTLTIAILTIDYPRDETYKACGREGIAEVAIENYRDVAARIPSSQGLRPQTAPVKSARQTVTHHCSALE